MDKVPMQCNVGLVVNQCEELFECETENTHEQTFLFQIKRGVATEIAVTHFMSTLSPSFHPFLGFWMGMESGQNFSIEA